MPILPIILVALIVLKLVGIIAWPWLWVMSPLFFLVGLLILQAMGLAVIRTMFNRW